jgi:hypothetical protein
VPEVSSLVLIERRQNAPVESILLSAALLRHERSCARNADHVGVFIETDPQWAPAQFVGKIKANASLVLRVEFPHFRSRLPRDVEPIHPSLASAEGGPDRNTDKVGLSIPVAKSAALRSHHRGKFVNARIAAVIGLNCRLEGCFYPRDDACFELKKEEIVAAASFHCRGAGEI